MITQEFLNQSLNMGMKKSAQVSGSAKSSLIGAGLGAGLGGLAWLLRPKDRDQNQWMEALISILGGAALGGAGGWGFHHLTNKTPWDATKAVGKKTKDIVTEIVNQTDTKKEEKKEEKKELPQPEKPVAIPAVTPQLTPEDKEEAAREEAEALKERRLSPREVKGTKFYGQRLSENGPIIHYPKAKSELKDDDLRLISDRPGGKNRVFGFAELMAALTDGKNKQWLSNAAAAANKSGDVVKPMYVEWNPDGTIVLTGINSKGQYGASKYKPPVYTVRLPNMPQKAKDVLRKLQGLWG